MWLRALRRRTNPKCAAAGAAVLSLRPSLLLVRLPLICLSLICLSSICLLRPFSLVPCLYLYLCLFVCLSLYVFLSLSRSLPLSLTGLSVSLSVLYLSVPYYILFSLSLSLAVSLSIYRATSLSVCVSPSVFYRLPPLPPPSVLPTRAHPFLPMLSSNS